MSSAHSAANASVPVSQTVSGCGPNCHHHSIGSLSDFEMKTSWPVVYRRIVSRSAIEFEIVASIATVMTSELG